MYMERRRETVLYMACLAQKIYTGRRIKILSDYNISWFYCCKHSHFLLILCLFTWVCQLNKEHKQFSNLFHSVFFCNVLISLSITHTSFFTLPLLKHKSCSLFAILLFQTISSSFRLFFLHSTSWATIFGIQNRIWEVASKMCHTAFSTMYRNGNRKINSQNFSMQKEKKTCTRTLDITRKLSPNVETLKKKNSSAKGNSHKETEIKKIMKKLLHTNLLFAMSIVLMSRS